MYLHINLEITLFRQTIKIFFVFLHLSSYKALSTGCWKLCSAKNYLDIQTGSSDDKNVANAYLRRLNARFKSQFAALVWT